MKKFSLTVMIAVLLTAVVSSCEGTTQTADYNVIPKPQEVSLAADGGEFKLSESTVIVNGEPGNDTLARYAGFLGDYIDQLTGCRLKVVDEARDKDAIVLTTASYPTIERHIGSASPLTYHNTGIDAGRRALWCADAPQVYSTTGKRRCAFPAVNIADYPRFGYRGAMLDVVRHFFR